MGLIAFVFLRSPSDLLIWSLSISFLVLLIDWSYRAVAGPLSAIPNIHWLVPWTAYYNLYLKYFYNIRVSHYEAHLCDGNQFETRPIVRVGPNEVSVMSTAAIKKVFGGGFERSPWYSVFTNFGKYNMFSSSSSQAHSRRKRIFASAYSKSSVTQGRAHGIIKSCVMKLTSFVEQRGSSMMARHEGGGPVVVRHLFRALQADVFTSFAFSEESGTRFLDNLNHGANTMEDLGMSEMDLFHDETRDEFFFWESEKPFKYIYHLVKKHGPTSHKRAQRWISELVSKHERRLCSTKAESASNENSVKRFGAGVYDKLFLYRDPETGNALEWTDKASEIMDHAVAGQDAVPAALEFMIRQISTHANVQSKLRLELLTSLPLESNDRTFAMIDTLPYLNAVVMESLRLVDTISSYQTRIVPMGGCVISGHYLPARTIVAAQPYIINRQPDIFPSPNAFNPSRWLLPRENYRELAKSMWTYSSGPRSCIGRELSLTIMKTLLADVYIRHRTTLINPDRKTKRPWEGADLMAEVRFDNVLACQDGEWIEKRAMYSSTLLVDGAEPAQEPVRRTSVFESAWTNHPSATQSPSCASSARQPPPSQPIFNLSSFAPPTSTEDKENNPPRPQPQESKQSLVPLPMGPLGQKAGELVEDPGRRPSLMPMDIAEKVEEPVLRKARQKRPPLMHMKTAPQRVNGVLEGL